MTYILKENTLPDILLLYNETCRNLNKKSIPHKNYYMVQSILRSIDFSMHSQFFLFKKIWHHKEDIVLGWRCFGWWMKVMHMIVIFCGRGILPLLIFWKALTSFAMYGDRDWRLGYTQTERTNKLQIVKYFKFNLCMAFLYWDTYLHHMEILN